MRKYDCHKETSRTRASRPHLNDSRRDDYRRINWRFSREKEIDDDNREAEKE